MEKYIFTEKNRVHIINLRATLKKVNDAYNFIQKIAGRGGEILFVGTRRKDKDIIREVAQRTGSHYVTER